MLEFEKRKLGGVGSGYVILVLMGDEGEFFRVLYLFLYLLLGGNVRVNDIIWKNEVSCIVLFFLCVFCVSVFR